MATSRSSAMVLSPFEKGGSVYPVLKEIRQQKLTEPSLVFREFDHLWSWLSFHSVRGLPVQKQKTIWPQSISLVEIKTMQIVPSVHLCPTFNVFSVAFVVFILAHGHIDFTLDHMFTLFWSVGVLLCLLYFRRTRSMLISYSTSFQDISPNSTFLINVFLSLCCVPL